LLVTVLLFLSIGVTPDDTELDEDEKRLSNLLPSFRTRTVNSISRRRGCQRSWRFCPVVIIPSANSSDILISSWLYARV